MMQKKKTDENTILSSHRGSLLTACGLPEAGIQFLHPRTFATTLTACGMSHHRSQNGLQRQCCRSCCRQHYLKEYVYQKVYLKMEMETMKLSNTKLLDLICQQSEYTNATLMTPGEKAPKPIKASH